MLGVRERLVTLPRRGWADRRAVFTLRWEGGRARSERVESADERTVVRRITPERGTLRRGDRVLMDREIFDDPSELGCDYREVVVTGELGDLPAWSVGGAGDLWAVMVHGRGADRREPLRALGALAERGIPALLISYRGDAEVDPIPDGLARMGCTEWRDVEAALRFAHRRGARRVLLVGFSLGGGMALTTARLSPLSSLLAGVVLDGPFLQPEATLRGAARRRGLPEAMVPLAMRAAERRAGIDLSLIDQVANADDLAAPVLAIQGSDDEACPRGPLDAFVARRPDLVTLRIMPAAGHVESWNVDQATYRRWIHGFLDEVAPRG